MTKITVTLDEQQLLELDRIILDEDEPEALPFLEEIEKKVKVGRGGSSGSAVSH